jgi:hypothetical protein
MGLLWTGGKKLFWRPATVTESALFLANAKGFAHRSWSKRWCSSRCLSSYQGFANQDDFQGSKEHGGNRQDCGTDSHLSPSHCPSRRLVWDYDSTFLAVSTKPNAKNEHNAWSTVQQGEWRKSWVCQAQEATLANVYREVVATVPFEKIMMYFHRQTIYSFGLSFVCCRALWTWSHASCPIGCRAWAWSFAFALLACLTAHLAAIPW